MYRNLKNVECTDLEANCNLEEGLVRGSKSSNTFGLFKLVSKFNLNLLFYTIDYNLAHCIAKYIHANSNRSMKSFVKYNCNGKSGKSIDLELFGCEPGTYRDFPEGKKGILEICNGGTVYFEEMFQLPLFIQYKLIDLVEAGILNKIGSNGKINADIKLIISTKKDFNHLIKEGLLLEGLYYSLFSI